MNSSSDPSSIQFSIYVISAHLPAHLKSISLKRVSEQARFVIEVTGTLDIRGYGDLDGKDIPIALRAEVDFEGVILVPGDLFPKPTSSEKVSEALKPFLALENFADPEWDRFRYVVRPAT